MSRSVVAIVVENDFYFVECDSVCRSVRRAAREMKLNLGGKYGVPASGHERHYEGIRRIDSCFYFLVLTIQIIK